MGKQSGCARRYETRHGSGTSIQETGASHFTSGRWYEKEVLTNAFSNNEANTQEIERMKIGSNKICVREDLAKEKMVFSVRLRFPQEVVSAVRIKGSSITKRLETHCGVLQKATEDLLQSGTDGKMMRSRGNLSLPITGRTHWLDTLITLYISVFTIMRRNRTYFIYAVLTKTDRHHLYRRDQGTGKRKRN